MNTNQLTELSDKGLDENAIFGLSVQDSAIQTMRDIYLPMRISGVDDAQGFKDVHEARMLVKNKRCEVEALRVKLKEAPLRLCQKIDAEANRIKGMLKPIEDHLEGEEHRIVAERARIKREAEDAERRKREEEMRARMAEEERIKREQLQLEEARIESERRQLEEERALIAAERRKLEQRETLAPLPVPPPVPPRPTLIRATNNCVLNGDRNKVHLIAKQLQDAIDWIVSTPNWSPEGQEAKSLLKDAYITMGHIVNRLKNF